MTGNTKGRGHGDRETRRELQRAAEPCTRAASASHLPFSVSPRLCSPSRGLALVIILAVLVMVTVLVVALLTLATGERSASSLSLQRTQAEILADAAADRAMASIDAAIAVGSGTGKSWASEPGRITSFTIADGTGAISQESHDLFSAAPDATTGNVDLNAPSLSGNYPIAPDATMKIGWKNLLRDPSQIASATNPIVARVAYWVDDESCKVNINTADGSRIYNEGRYGVQPSANITDGYSFGFGTPSGISLAGLPGLNQTEARAIADTAWEEEFNSVEELIRAKDGGGTQVVTSAEVDSLRFNITNYNSSPDLNFMGEPRIALLPLFSSRAPVENTFLGEMLGTREQQGNLQVRPGGQFDQLYPQPSQLLRPDFLPGSSTDPWYLHTFAGGMGQEMTDTSADYLVGDLITHLLNGTNLQGQSFTWPAFPGANVAGFAGKYTDRQMDSITLQILDTLKAAMADQGAGAYTPPGILPVGWLSGEPVLGIGRSPRLNEIRLIADVTVGDPLGFGVKIGDPSYAYPLLQLGIYYEFYFPKGFAGIPNYMPYEGATSQSAFYGFKPMVAGSPVIPGASGSLNFVDATGSRFSPPEWRNRILRAVDQNGDPAGIDFAGTSSQKSDPDQVQAETYHPYARKFNGAIPADPKDYTGSVFSSGTNSQPVLDARSPFGAGDDRIPGAYSMKSNLRSATQYPARPDATEIHLRGGLQPWVRHVGGTYGYRISALAPFESALPELTGASSLPGDFTEMVLPVDFSIPVPGHREYVLHVSDPLVNQYPADWEVIENSGASDITMPAPYGYNIHTVAETYKKGGSDSRDPFYDPPEIPTSGNVPRAMIDFDGDNSGFKPSGGGDPLSIWLPPLDPRIPKLARFPSVGALFSLRTGLFPDVTVKSQPMLQQHGTPWRALNMGPSSQSSQQTEGGTSYPDWAMLDLFYVPSLPQKPYGPVVPDDPGPQPFRRLTYGGATIGRININNPLVPYPFDEDPGINTSPPERKALEALFFNLQPSKDYDASGDPIYTTIDAAAATNLADAVATYQDSNGPFFMAGQIANVPAVAAFLYTGVAAEAQSRNDLVRDTIGAITTRSNVYSVWVVVQTIKKASENTDYGNFEDGDMISAEVRRHYLVERHIETGADGVPGNAVTPSVTGTPNAYLISASTGDPVTPSDPDYHPQLSYPLPYRWRIVSMENIQR